MKFQDKFVRRQLELMSSLADNISLANVRRAQDTLGSFMRFTHRRDVVINNTVGLALELGKLVIMGCKKRFRADFFRGVFDDGARDAHTVVGACASTNLIKQDKTAVREVVQNTCRLQHLDHKCRFALRDII